MLKQHNVRMKSSNVRKKVKEPPNMRKKMIICDVGTAQCENGTVKYEKKVRKLPNVIKELSHIMLDAQCDDRIVKCEKKK